MSKTAMVAGGSGGIGSAIVEALQKEGINVCSTYYGQKSKKEGTDQYEVDLADENSTQKAMKAILSKHGKIDIVVLSATIPIKNKPLLAMEWKDMQQHIEVQAKGLLSIVKALHAQIKSGHKTKFIIVLTEYCIGKPPAGVSHYVTAKYALMGLAKSMAAELPKYNCTVNMVSPGMVDTTLLSTLPPKLVELTAEKNPLKRIASPKDVANVVLFLSKDESDYLNGVHITVNGGERML